MISPFITVFLCRSIDIVYMSLGLENIKEYSANITSGFESANGEKEGVVWYPKPGANAVLSLVTSWMDGFIAVILWARHRHILLFLVLKHLKHNVCYCKLMLDFGIGGKSHRVYREEKK